MNNKIKCQSEFGPMLRKYIAGVL